MTADYLCLLDRPCKVPDERQRATEVTDAARKTWHGFEQPPKQRYRKRRVNGNYTDIPLRISPGTTDQHLENSGTSDSCHHLENKTKQTVPIMSFLLHRTEITAPSSTSTLQQQYSRITQGAKRGPMSYFKIKDLLCCLLLTSVRHQALQDYFYWLS